AWVQHMIASANPKTGRIAVVLPQGALFRQGAEAKIRRAILQADLIDAVIGLAPNLFYGTGLAACVLILKLNKQSEEEGKVLFINAEDLHKKGRNQNSLEPEHADEILATYELYRDREGRAHVVGLDEIKANDYNLNIPLYVAPADDGKKITLAEALANLEAAQAHARQTRAAMEAELVKWALGQDPTKEVGA
ncbi:N-6 DNA methylase, partial [Streptomyces sp. SID7982]|nr:N-6 DNA methylase [Streptomyces sp. SID7982]